MARFPPPQITEAQALEALEQSRGKLLPAARLLNVSDSWLSRFLKHNGYIQVVKWERPA